MVPSYDFDIHWLIPREVEADPAIGKLLADIGFNGRSRGNFVALFRDPQVVAMIERADPVLRAFLQAGGFGFTTGKSSAPAGLYPADDETARSDVIERLNENVDRFDLDGADLGGFDLGAFCKTIAAARPLPPEPVAPSPSPFARPDLALALGETPPPRLARLTGRNRVMPLMVLSLAVTLGLYLVIQHIEAAPVPI